MEYTFKVESISNSAYPSFFMIKLKSPDNKIHSTVMPTVQVSRSKVLLSGKKPERVPEFEHLKLSIIFAGKFNPELNFNERKDIHSNKNNIVTVKELLVHNQGSFEVIIDNDNEVIYLDRLSEL